MSTPDTPDALRTGPFSGPTEFAQLIRDALECAAREGWMEMVWSDANFEEWPLRESAVVESLNAWSQRGRRLVMLAHSYDSVQRYQARFVEWRIRWDHLIECRVCKQLSPTEFPSVLWSPHWFVRRLDLARSTVVASYEAQRRVLQKQELDECRRQSAPGFPASTLGL